MPIGAGDPRPIGSGLTVGVLALQGAFEVHRQRLRQLGASAPLVKNRGDLEALDGLVLPGGESTTMSHLLTTDGLFEELQARLADGLAVFGTCAGMILCATETIDGRPDQRGFGLIDITVRRNGYGRQLDSFETDLDVAGLDTPFHAVFIRAPLVERVGPDVEVLARHDGAPVMARHGRCTVASFHPELAADDRLHALFLQSLGTAS